MFQAKQESRFEYKGYPCVVLFMPLGYRCGYVGLPKGNKYYGKKYNNIPVNCHCGLTYSYENLNGQDDKDTWWIGFDCAHYGDGLDYESAKRLYSDSPETVEVLRILKEILGGNSGITLEYVENECRKIVDQIE